MGGTIPAGDPRISQRRRRFRRVAALFAAIGLLATFGWLKSAWIGDRIQAFRIDRSIGLGHLDDARTGLALQIHRHPARPWPRFLLARIERRSGRLTEAEQILQRAVELGLPVAEAARERGLIAASVDFSAAERGLIATLAVDDRDPEIHRALAGGYLRSARWDAAVASCSAWLAVEPSSVEAMLGRAQALRRIGRGVAAIADCRAILARSPDHFEARLALAEMLIEVHRVAEARSEADRCRDRAPDRPEPLVILAACSSALGDPEGADSTLARALEFAPNWVPALRAMASAQQARGRMDQARALLDRAALLDLGPGGP